MTAQSVDYRISVELERSIKSWRMRAGSLGLIGLILTLIGAVTERDQFFRSYLWSYVFFVGLAVGCLAWLMAQNLTGGAWGVMTRRICEAAAQTIPVLMVLLIPVLLGIHSLYSWSHPDIVAADPVLAHKQSYLNVPFFIVRGFVYMAGWSLLGWLLSKWSGQQDREGGREPNRKMARISGPGLVFWGFGVTFMATDWVLSLDPHWFSTMFGLLFIAGQGLTSISFMIVMMVILYHHKPMSELITNRHMHDLGNLMLANVMVWAYFAFSQFLIIWAGNLPDEIPWYLERLRGGWEYVGFLLVIGHFALPFALLLSRDLKRSFRMVSWIACLVFVMRFVDVYWLVAPDSLKHSFSLSWMDFTAPVGLGGLWLALFLTNLLKRPLLPVNEPDLEEALAHGR